MSPPFMVICVHLNSMVAPVKVLSVTSETHFLLFTRFLKWVKVWFLSNNKLNKNSSFLNEKWKITRDWSSFCWVLYSFLGYFSKPLICTENVLIRKREKIIKRGITFLAVDYKSLAMAYVNRVKTRLYHIVAETQSNFIKDCYISITTRPYQVSSILQLLTTHIHLQEHLHSVSVQTIIASFSLKLIWQQTKWRNFFSASLCLFIHWLSQMLSARKLIFCFAIQLSPFSMLPSWPKIQTLAWITQCGTSQFKKHWMSLFISLLPHAICFRLDKGDLQTWLTSWINAF